MTENDPSLFSGYALAEVDVDPMPAVASGDRRKG
jgi:hypothetical protein